METLVLMPMEFGLAPLLTAQGAVGRLAVHSEQYVVKGTRFLPFEGTVRFARFHLEPFLPQHDVRCKFGSFDMIQELDNNRKIRQCNWVRFVIATEDRLANTCSSQQTAEGETKCGDGVEANMSAVLLDGQPVFEVTRSILPHTPIVVQFQGLPVHSGSAPAELQDSPLDLSKSLMGPTKPQLFVTSADGTGNRARLSQKSLLPCDVCGKVFDRPSLLKRHMRTHTGEKPHICEVCNKGFSTSSSLNTHRRIHSGDKPHQCLVCGKRFTASSNLYYHRMTHTKEKPHKCGQCSKSFPTPGDLKAHMYIHSGSWPYRCNVCSRGFSKQTNLRNHLFLHTGDRPYPCKFCGKKFALACNLRAHTKTHHSDNKTKSDKETSSQRTGSTTTKCYDNNEARHEDKPDWMAPRETKDTNCKIHNSWHAENDTGTQAVLVAAQNKCSPPTPDITPQQPSCSLIKNFQSLDSAERTLIIPAANFTDINKRQLRINPSNCVLDNVSKSVTSSDQLVGYTNILEELWPANSPLINQCNIPLSVLPTPFNINMPCITSISLVDLQALLLMQAANMAMLHGGNIAFNDGKSLKKQMGEPAQSRSVLLA